MPRKTETLLQALNTITNMYTRGQTTAALDGSKFIQIESLITIAERLAEIESHLEAIAISFEQAQESPINLETLTIPPTKRKAKIQGG